MQQDIRNSYRTNENLFQAFYHSCFGKLVILLIFIVIMMIIALFTVPSKEKMETEMMDNIRECIQENDSIAGDAIDDAIGNVLRIFSTADTTVNDQEVMEAFHKYNRLEIYHHTLFSTARLHNNLKPEGIRVGIGIYNVVIPTVRYSDIILFVSTIRNYNKRRLIEPMTQDEYVGENPNIHEYHYLGDPEN